jgi:hypothetical protein
MSGVQAELSVTEKRTSSYTVARPAGLTHYPRCEHSRGRHTPLSSGLRVCHPPPPLRHPPLSGFFEVEVNGELVHSKKVGSAVGNFRTGHV